jgi:hypothetical protein
MTTPLVPELHVGYVPAEDVYIVYSEYYGDGTIYGRRALTLPSGEAILGRGKLGIDLVALGAVVSETGETVNGELEAVPYEAPAPEAPAPEVPAPEAPAPIEKSVNKVTVRVNGIVITCNAKLTHDIQVSVDESAGTVQFDF